MRYEMLFSNIFEKRLDVFNNNIFFKVILGLAPRYVEMQLDFEPNVNNIHFYLEKDQVC